jgi:hypothetical protein
MSFRRAFLDVVATLSDPSDPADVENNAYVEAFIQRNESNENRLKRIQEINDLYVGQVELFYASGTVPPQEIQLILNKLSDHYTETKHCNDAIVAEVIANHGNHIMGSHVPICSKQLQIPTTIRLYNDPETLQLVKVIELCNKEAESSPDRHYRGSYRGQEVVARVVCMSHIEPVHCISLASIQSRFASHFPECTVPLLTTGIVYGNEEDFHVDVLQCRGEMFCETVAQKPLARLQDDIVLCLKTLRTLNQLGQILLLNSDRMLLCCCANTRVWRIIDTGLSLENKDKEEIDAGQFLMAVWAKRPDIPEVFLRSVSAEFPMVFGRTNSRTRLRRQYGEFLRKIGAGVETAPGSGEKILPKKISKFGADAGGQAINEKLSEKKGVGAGCQATVCGQSGQAINGKLSEKQELENVITKNILPTSCHATKKFSSDAIILSKIVDD